MKDNVPREQPIVHMDIIHPESFHDAVLEFKADGKPIDLFTQDALVACMLIATYDESVLENLHDAHVTNCTNALTNAQKMLFYIDDETIASEMHEIARRIRSGMPFRPFVPNFFVFGTVLHQVFRSDLEHFKLTSKLLVARHQDGLYVGCSFVSADAALLEQLFVDVLFRRMKARFVKQLPRKKPYLRRHQLRRPIESRLRHEVFKRDGFRCVECGATPNETTLHCDHIVTVAQGGTDELSNLQTLCRECNLAKSDKTFRGGKAA